MKTKYHHQPTAKELEVFDELERMSQHAEKHDKHFSMSGQRKTVNKNTNPLKRKNPMSNLQRFEGLIDAQVSQGVKRHIAVQNAMRSDPELGQQAEAELAAEIKNRQDQTTPQQSTPRAYGSR